MLKQYVTFIIGVVVVILPQQPATQQHTDLNIIGNTSILLVFLKYQMLPEDGI
jgi:hypothetical protein